MTTGTEFAKLVRAAAMTPMQWTAFLLNQYLGPDTSSIPASINVSRWPLVTVKETLTDGRKATLTYAVMPDTFSIGTDADPLRLPLPPEAIQTLATHYNSVMLSRKMVRDVTKQAAVIVPLQIPSVDRVTGKKIVIPSIDMEKFPAALEHNALVSDRVVLEPGKLISGHSKDVVTGPNLKPGKLAIYGGVGGKVDGLFWQPYPGPHPSSYVDYSQHGRVAFRTATLSIDNGPPSTVDLLDVYQHPLYHVLVSDQGAFDPTYPTNASTPTPASTTSEGSGTMPSPPMPQTSSARPSMAGPIALGVVTTAFLLKTIFL